MKKVLTLILALSMVCCLFAACGTEEAPEANNAATEATTASTTDAAPAEEAKTPASEKLIMATNAAFPPYEYKEGDEFKGIDVEIADAIAKELGMELEIADMEFDSIITAVDNGAAHVGIAGMTVTDERKEQVDFSHSYATGIQSIIVTEDSAIASSDDLTGKKIGVQLGTTGDIYATDDFGSENVTQYGKGADAVLALKGGDVDAVIIDNEPAKAFVEANEGLKILDGEDYAIEDYAIAVKKGNTELLDKINAALEKLKADGTIDAIISKYISAE